MLAMIYTLLIYCFQNIYIYIYSLINIFNVKSFGRGHWIEIFAFYTAKYEWHKLLIPVLKTEYFRLDKNLMAHKNKTYYTILHENAVLCIQRCTKEVQYI